MNHPLDGARLKVVRAQEQLGAIKEEVGRYLDSHPYEISSEREKDVVRGKLVITNEPPLWLSCLIGECVNGLRASLDYIVWELASRHSPTPLEVGKDRIYFPIQKDATRFNTDGLAKYSIPAAALSLIENVQPYHAGHELLEFLPILTNEDRHRLPLLTLAGISSSSFQVHHKGQHVFGIVGCVVNETGQVVGGLNGISAILKAPDPGVPEQATDEVEVKGQATVFVAFQNLAMPREPIDRLLEQMVKCIAHIVPRFEPFL